MSKRESFKIHRLVISSAKANEKYFMVTNAVSIVMARRHAFMAGVVITCSAACPRLFNRGRKLCRASPG